MVQGGNLVCSLNRTLETLHVVKTLDSFIQRSHSSHIELGCSSNFPEWLLQSWRLQMSRRPIE